jgi:hypothetical protein
MADTTVMTARLELSLNATVVGSLYVIALIAATPFAYAGTMWLNASERGWQTQVAAAGLIVGWLALAVGAVFVWQSVKAKRRPSAKVIVASCVAAGAAYAIVFAWGGGMLI